MIEKYDTLEYALRNSARHVSEQNSFFPFWVGKTYFNDCLLSTHHVQQDLLRGRPDLNIVRIINKWKGHSNDQFSYLQ